MPEITDECTFNLRMEGKKGEQKLKAEIRHEGEIIASVNWCGGCSQKKGFKVKMERPNIKIFKEG